MRQGTWRVVSALALICMAAVALVGAIRGGCSTLIECTSGTFVHMTCFWTFHAVALVGCLGVLSSLMALFAATKEGRRISAGMTVLIGIAILLLPTSFVMGICSSDATMHCNVSAYIVWALGICGIILALVQLVKADPSEGEKPKLGL